MRNTCTLKQSAGEPHHVVKQDSRKSVPQGLIFLGRQLQRTRQRNCQKVCPRVALAGGYSQVQRVLAWQRLCLVDRACVAHPHMFLLWCCPHCFLSRKPLHTEPTITKQQAGCCAGRADPVRQKCLRHSLADTRRPARAPRGMYMRSPGRSSTSRTGSPSSC